MFSREHIFGLVALAQGAATVVLYSPHGKGFLNNTFFEVPYPFAYVFVPLSCTILGYFSSRYWLKNLGKSASAVRQGVAVAVTAFFAYGLLHFVVVAVFNNVALAAAVFFAFLVFGGILFLPVSVVLAIIAAVVGKKLYPSNTRLEVDVP